MIFVSNASELVGGDSNGTAGIFLYDRSQDQIQRLSISNSGDPGNGWSYQPAISADGRYVVFTSLSTNLDPKSGVLVKQAHIFLRDLVRNQTSLISINHQGEPANGWSEWPSISGDGRFIAFASLASNLISGETNQAMDVFLYDRKLGQIEQISGADGDLQQLEWNTYPIISADGRYVAYLAIHRRDQANSTDLLIYDRLTGKTSHLSPSSAGASLQIAPVRPAISADGHGLVFSAREDGHNISLYFYDGEHHQISQIPDSQIENDHFPSFSISANGRFVTYFSSAQKITWTVRTFDQENGQSSPLPITLDNTINDLNGNQLALSANGAIMAIASPSIQTARELTQSVSTSTENGGLSIYKQDPYEQFPAFVSGWVSDGSGYPLAGVTITDDYGHSTLTDKNGSFRIDGLISASYTLTPEKKGYEFSPAEQKVSIASVRNSTGGISFTAAPKGVLDEAQKDIGMPYALTRGCPSPKIGCGGPFHGFFSGDCTDLVIDAYKEGVGFDIQFAIDRDFQAHPDHYYFWRNARSSQDMWRYFAYTGQIQKHTQPYLPGDIVFFDWDSDGVSDHVAIVSEVSNRGRPLKMFDASGFTKDNPSGLAAELPWQQYHDAQVLGHVRWSGNPRPESQTPDKQDNFLVVALDSLQATVRLLDDQGNSIGEGEIQIDGGTFEKLYPGSVITLRSPEAHSEWYFIEISSQASSIYTLGIQAVNTGSVTKDVSYQRSIEPGVIQLIPLKIVQSDENFSFNDPQIPENLGSSELSGLN